MPNPYSLIPNPQTKLPHPVQKIRRFLVQAVAEAFVHIKRRAGDLIGDFPGRLAGDDPVVRPADDQGGAGDPGELFIRVVADAGRRLDQEAVKALRLSDISEQPVRKPCLFQPLL